jgi:hypothetical protein
VKIVNNKIFTDEGQYLKSLDCPYKYNELSINGLHTNAPDCVNCNKTIVNTDFVTENQLMALIDADNDICLLINQCNPMFKIEIN